MKKMLTQPFFNRPAPVVAKDLLGKYLVRRRNGEIRGYVIVEVEAYDGFDDKTSHAAQGKTKRNAPMFASGGVFYVYFCYGMHWMLNVVTGAEGYPAAVLIRGIKGVKGERGINGPGRLTKTLGIDKRINEKTANKKNGLWFEDRGVIVPEHAIKKTARVGVGAHGDGGEKWIKKPLRFVVQEKKKGWKRKKIPLDAPFASREMCSRGSIPNAGGDGSAGAGLLRKRRRCAPACVSAS